MIALLNVKHGASVVRRCNGILAKSGSRPTQSSELFLSQVALSLFINSIYHPRIFLYYIEVHVRSKLCLVNQQLFSTQVRLLTITLTVVPFHKTKERRPIKTKESQSIAFLATNYTLRSVLVLGHCQPANMYAI